MNLLLIFPGFILAFIIILYYKRKIRRAKLRMRNKVRFYVARDQNGLIYLYLGRPARRRYNFLNHGSCSYFITNEYNFKQFGISPDYFKDLKWGDEPVEVFLNLED